MAYPFKDIEQKWQKFWEEDKTFKTPTDKSRPKYYILDMFPYPSGAGLHVGHPEGYTATDIMARYKRMRGFNVLHPMGWDAFGLPAERHAMQTGIHPSETTAKNIANFRRQLQDLGFSYDWEREINTTDEKYYKWTQWIFLKIFNSWYDEEQQKSRPISELPIPEGLDGAQKEEFVKGKRLAYMAEIPVNWCAKLGTVLANEEVDEWIDKGYTVERRPMRQWMLRITAYGDRLLEDLKYVEWPSGTLELQKNWIGRSEGAEVDFPALDVSGKETGQNIRIYTTRPDTLYGVTYMVLAPEHPSVAALTTDEQKAAVAKYIDETKLKSDRARQIEKSKTGVFTGGFLKHPLSGEKVPVWISDYVMMGYGTGAIMAVPGHDERDQAFAKAFGLEIRYVVKPKKAKNDDWQKEGAYSGHGINFNSDIINDLPTPKAIEKMIAHLEDNKLGEKKVNFKLRDWLFSRQRYWGEPMPISFDEDGALHHEADESLPLILPDSDEFQPADTGESPLANLTDWVNHKSKDGKALKRETNTMPQWAGSCWYYLRYISPDWDENLVNPEDEKYWMGDSGVDLYIGGAEHAVLHLLYARFWHKVLYDLGVVSTLEPFKKLVHQGLILGEMEYLAFKDESGAYVTSSQVKSLGGGHYAHKKTQAEITAESVLPTDITKKGDGFVLTADPAIKVDARAHKMSKSRGNVVNPDDMVRDFGADSLRLYEMFLGPLEQMKPWSTKGVEGVSRFLNRAWRVFTLSEKKDEDIALGDAVLDPAVLEEPPAELQKARERLLHATVKKVTEDIENLSFNTAISQLMIFVNEVFGQKQLGRDSAEAFAVLLSPFAPHMAEQLWALLGNTDSVAKAEWPGFDASKLEEDEVEVVFQVNGKMRGKVKVAKGSDDEALKAAALADDNVKKSMDGKEPKRIIVVKGKLVNVVV